LIANRIRSAPPRPPPPASALPAASLAIRPYCLVAQGGLPGLPHCGGPFDLADGQYLDNIVVYSHLMS
jgi:hypothetical protein